VTTEEQPVRPAGRVPRPTALLRLAAISTLLTVLLGADAVSMQLSQHHTADRNNNFQLSDAATMFIATGLLFVLTLALFTLWQRARRVVR